jgi:kinesin family protein 4/21/27
MVGSTPSPLASGRTTPSGLRPPSAQSMRPSGSGDHGATSVQVGTSWLDTNAPSLDWLTALRIRPQTSADTSANVPARFQRIAVQPVPSSSTSVAVDAASASGSSANAAATARTPKQYFSFDRVYGPDDGQRDIFSSVEPLLERFLEGYNTTILACPCRRKRCPICPTDHAQMDRLAVARASLWGRLLSHIDILQLITTQDRSHRPR